MISSFYLKKSEFHNAETQTNRAIKKITCERNNRDTQTYEYKNVTFQTSQDASTQMTKVKTPFVDEELSF